jgi:hypothetical protein
MKFPLSHFILCSFVQGFFILFFSISEVISPKALISWYLKGQTVFCAVGTENANNILTSFLLPNVKQKLVRRVDFIITPP